MGKLSINGSFAMAMLNNQMVPGRNTHRKNPSVWPHCLGNFMYGHGSKKIPTYGRVKEWVAFLERNMVIVIHLLSIKRDIGGLGLKMKDLQVTFQS